MTLHALRRWLWDSAAAPAAPAAFALNCVLLLGAGGLLAAVVLHGSAGNWEAVRPYAPALWQGWLLTVGLSLAALVFSSALGLLAAALRKGPFLPLRALAAVYIEGVRGSPFLVLILVGYYVVLDRAGWHERLSAGVLLLSVFSGAYLAEIFRAGWEAVGASQLETAKAIGLTRWQAFRLVVLPQALRHVLPPMAGQFASIIKDSSLLSIIGISEFTFAAQQVNAATYSTLESLLPLAPGYLALTLPVSLWSRWLERRAHFET